MKLKRMWHTIRLILCREGYRRAAYIKKNHLLGSIGDQCYFHPFKVPCDAPNIYLGNNVKVAAGVSFINHDIIGSMLNVKLNTEDFRYSVRDIVVEDNVMIGAYAIILPGVTIHSDCIIGAGTVVSKDIPSNSVAVGNPVRIVGTLDQFIDKRRREDAAR